LRVKESRGDARALLEELHAAMAGGPMITFEGKSGERYGGEVERVITTPAFTVKLGDASLGELWPKGALLFFVAGPAPGPGAVFLLRHRKSKLLAMRRHDGGHWRGLAPWQPAYELGHEWLPVGRLQLIVPRAPH
jgi:hypothetical protein